MPTQLYVICNRLVAAASPMEAVERSGLPPAYIPEAVLSVQLAQGPLFRKGIYSGTSPSRAHRLGAHVGINARAGEFWRNDYGNDYKIDRRNARKALADFEGRILRYRLLD